MAPRTVVEHSKVSRALNVKNSEIEDCGSVEKLKKQGFFCKKKTNDRPEQEYTYS